MQCIKIAPGLAIWHFAVNKAIISANTAVIETIITANAAVINMWTHERPDWPKFTWDVERLTSRLADIRYSQGHLVGRIETADTLHSDSKSEFSLSALTDDVVKSSAIEGEHINPEEARSSIAHRLGMDIADPVPVSHDVEGIVDITLDSTQQFSNPLTKERLFSWHAALFPEGRSGMHRITVGNWRTLEVGPMQVVSGPIGRRKVHFEAPSADRLDKEMAAFLLWFNRKDKTDPILRAGIAHLWFVTIHPFEDGNGRTARAISDMALARAEGFSERFYSLSAQIASERKNYYDQLERQQHSTLEITGWLEWFLDCLERAIFRAEEEVSNVLFKAQFWSKINQKSINQRQRLIITRMLESDFKGYMNTSKYAKLAKCSKDTALRDIQDLKSREVFIQNPGSGRSTSYRLPDRDA